MRCLYNITIALLAVVFAMTAGVDCHAKNGKIKYGKHIVYEGEVVEKKPCGQGSLTFTNASKSVVAKIRGYFYNQSARNITFESSVLPQFKAIGGIVFETDEPTGKVTELKLTLRDVRFDYEGAGYTFPFLTFTAGDTKGEWDFVGNPDKTDCDESLRRFGQWYEGEMFVASYHGSKPDCLAGLGWAGGEAFRGFRLFCHQLAPCTPIVYKCKDYLYDFKTARFHPVKAPDPKNDRGFACIGGGDWEGERYFFNNSKVAKDKMSDEVKVYDANNTVVYQGTLKNVMNPVHANCRGVGIDNYLDGVYRPESSSAIKYLNGESEIDIRRRMKTNGIDSDLIDEVINRKMVESAAAEAQRERDAAAVDSVEIVEAVETVEYAECDSVVVDPDEDELGPDEQRINRVASTLKSKWRCSYIRFSGKITASREGNKFLKSNFDIDNTYFVGVAELEINANGEGYFKVTYHPSMKARTKGLGVSNFINAVCNELDEEIEGDVYFIGNYVYIDDTPIGKISADNRSIVFDKLLRSVMTVAKKW